MFSHFANFDTAGDFPHESGVYVIQHCDSGKIYIGATSDLYVRFSLHRSSLKYGHHSCRDLQSLYDLSPSLSVWYQPTNNEAEAFVLEQRAVDANRYSGMLLNVAINDVTNTQKGITRTLEQRQRAAEISRGKTHSKETREKISKLLEGRPVSEETRKAISESRKLFNQTEIGRAQILARAAKQHTPVMIDGVRYPSIPDAARILNIKYATVYSRLQKESFPNYIFLEKD